MKMCFLYFIMRVICFVYCRINYMLFLLKRIYLCLGMIEIECVFMNLIRCKFNYYYGLKMLILLILNVKL